MEEIFDGPKDNPDMLHFLDEELHPYFVDAKRRYRNFGISLPSDLQSLIVAEVLELLCSCAGIALSKHVLSRCGLLSMFRGCAGGVFQ